METNKEVFDLPSALSSVGGDVDFLGELANLVQAVWPTVVGDIRNNLAAGNHRALATDARVAKTAAEYVSAGRAYMAALQLQMMALNRDWDGARQAATNLEGEVAKLQTALSTFTNSNSPPACQGLPEGERGRPFALGESNAVWSAGNSDLEKGEPGTAAGRGGDPNVGLGRPAPVFHRLHFPRFTFGRFRGKLKEVAHQWWGQPSDVTSYKPN